MRLTIEWDANYNGVHIKTDTGLSLIVSGQPSMVMSWHDAVRFYKDNKVWQLPTREHLQLIAARIDEVNAIIRANGGYEIRGWHWTADEYDEFCAWYVYMDDGSTYYYNKKHEPLCACRVRFSKLGLVL